MSSAAAAAEAASDGQPAKPPPPAEGEEEEETDERSGAIGEVANRTRPPRAGGLAMPHAESRERWASGGEGRTSGGGGGGAAAAAAAAAASERGVEGRGRFPFSPSLFFLVVDGFPAGIFSSFLLGEGAGGESGVFLFLGDE